MLQPILNNVNTLGRYIKVECVKLLMLKESGPYRRSSTNFF